MFTLMSSSISDVYMYSCMVHSCKYTIIKVVHGYKKSSVHSQTQGNGMHAIPLYEIGCLRL